MSAGRRSPEQRAELPQRLRTEAAKSRALIITQPVIDRWALKAGHLMDEAAAEIETAGIKALCPLCETPHALGSDELREGTDVSWECQTCHHEWRVVVTFFDTTPQTLGVSPRAIARMRRSRHLTQEQLGKLVGVTHAYISLIEAGTRTPKPALLRKIYEALGERELAKQVPA